jgi:RNA polymerase sigma-70 factor (ECF subfamily)
MDFQGAWLEWRSRIGSYLRSFSNLSAEDRKDVAAEAFMRAWEKRDGFDGSRSPGPWLLSIARRAALDQIRRGRGHRKVPNEAKETAPISVGVEDTDALPARWPPDPETACVQAETEDFVRSFVEALPSLDREIANLAYGQGFRMGDISSIVRLPEGTVKWRLHRIREKLRNQWEKRDEKL